MPKFRKKSIIVSATQWWKNGDHPDDDCGWVCPLPDSTTRFEPFLSEGKIVRYFRHPQVPGGTACEHCGVIYHDHGWIDTMEGGHVVCPGDWVIIDSGGEYHSVRNTIFAEIYELAE